MIAFGLLFVVLSAVFVRLWRVERRRAAQAQVDFVAADQQRQLLAESLDALPCNLAVFAPDGELVIWNSSYEALHRHYFETGSCPIYYADLMRSAARLLLPPEEVEADVAARVARHFGQETSSFERLYPDGRWMHANKQRLASGHIAGFALDITEMKRRERELVTSEARYKALVDTASVAIWHLDQAGQTLFGNRRLAQIFGGTPPGFGQAGLQFAVQTEDGPFGFPADREVEAAVCRSGDQTMVHLLVAASPWLGDHNSDRSCVLTMIDITPMRVAQQRLEFLAGHDPLTGLLNRAKFHEAMLVAVSDPGGCTLLLIDLDHFKAVNDNYGHATGDAVLCIAADRMVASLKQQDLVFRLGGDEFAVLIDGIDLSLAQMTAARLVAALSQPYRAPTCILTLSASIGIARSIVDAATPEDLAHAADVALYSVKRSGRAGVACYNADQVEADRSLQSTWSSEVLDRV